MSSATNVTSTPWGQVHSQPVDLFTLANQRMQVKVSTYGARITSVQTPDKAGVPGEVTLGAGELAPYLTDKAYIGAAIGRFGNRIAKGQFPLDGRSYQVPLNDGPNALHGGPAGFDRKIWAAEAVANGVRLSTVSPDGEMGFPGNLSVRITYTLQGQALAIEYEAVSDAATIVNLTNHAYWNLTGAPDSIAGHRLRLHASRFTPVDATLIPTGELRAVDGTVFDFRDYRPMGQDWDDAEEQIQLGRGYDHNWVIDAGGQPAGAPVLAAEVTEPVSGRSLRVFTTEPGIQFYSGNFLEGSFVGRGGRACERRSGFCLETQHFPDAPNQPAFPSTRLAPGAPFYSKTVLEFGA
jgi:aldose 1-epimerase